MLSPGVGCCRLSAAWAEWALEEACEYTLPDETEDAELNVDTETVEWGDEPVEVEAEIGEEAADRLTVGVDAASRGFMFCLCAAGAPAPVPNATSGVRIV